MPARKKTKGTPEMRQADAIGMLKADHQKVRKLFEEYDAAADRDIRRSVANLVFVELEMHTQLEENIFYPAVNEETEEGPELVKEAMLAHQLMKELMQGLRDMRPDTQAFDAKFHELRRHVEHHMTEEESEMFPLAEEELQDEMPSLQDEMQDLKAQFLAS